VNRGWLVSTRCKQKKASLRFRHINTLAVGGIKLSSVWVGDDRMNSFCCLVHLVQVLNWSIIIEPWLFERE
jgi:hypothetical protein